MATSQMPARGARGAPEFDSSKPRQLPRYFSDLELEFARVGVTDETEKKRHATRYVSVDDQDTWESLTEFTSVTTTYADFKKAVLKLYPGTDSDRKYTMSDLHSLIGEYATSGILSLSDYSEFYRRFITITTYLISKGRLSTAEQSRSFCRAISPPTLWTRVSQRLQIKRPDNHPDDPYNLADLTEAVEFVLAGPVTLNAPPLSSVPPSQSASSTAVKSEPDFGALLETMNGLMKVLLAQQQQPSRPYASPLPASPSAPRREGDQCVYCGGDHYISRCPLVEEDTKAGKCKRDIDGRVVLPTGAFVPRRIPGVNLRARIEEWHKQNPGQLAAGQMMLEVPTHLSSSYPASSQSNPAATFVLSEEERLASLEKEIFAIRTRAQARRALAAGASGESVEEPEQPVRASVPPPTPPAPPIAPAVPPSIMTRPTKENSPEHPYAHIRDAAYAPPRDRNVGAKPPVHAAKKNDPAYRTTAPIFDEKIASKVFDRSMDAPITLTHRELLSLSPESRKARHQQRHPS
ncbi:unnamed protein product [Mycena citricolor]|uniref:Uncharacterized protein n=1 Tax=Mycena citricolor TaxID=2018698 RepID=A0AAD2HJE5_9AGAR|nr:unnamed protein product [Mycena citricolor]